MSQKERVVSESRMSLGSEGWVLGSLLLSRKKKLVAMFQDTGWTGFSLETKILLGSLKQ